MLKQLFQKSSIIFISIICYFAIVELFVLFCKPSLFLNKEIFTNRVIYVVVFIVSYLLHSRIDKKLWNIITVILIYASLSGLYKETAILNQLFQTEIDPILIKADEFLWGFQPSLKFSEIYNSKWISELLFFGYFSYYLLPLLVFTVIYKKNHKKIEEFGFVLITSFLAYYVIFIILPAFGPQFFFSAPDNYIEAQGIFGKIIKVIQENGEAKTAAFPSSHVGISVIVLIWLFKNFRSTVVYFIPTTVLLILATVYIKAHYSIDVIAGFLTAPIIYYFSINVFTKLKVLKNEY